MGLDVPVIPMGEVSKEVYNRGEASSDAIRNLTNKAWECRIAGNRIPTDIEHTLEAMGVDIEDYPYTGLSLESAIPAGWVSNKAGEWRNILPKPKEEPQEEPKSCVEPVIAITQVPTTAPTQPDVLSLYRGNEVTIVYQFDQGDFKSTVCDVIVNDGCICIVSKVGASGSFTPKVGSNFKLEYKGEVYRCFYPPTHAIITALGLEVMMLGISKGDMETEGEQ